MERRTGNLDRHSGEEGDCPGIEQKLARALAEVVRAPALQSQIGDIGLIPKYENPASVNVRIAKELLLMRVVVTKAFIHAESA